MNHHFYPPERGKTKQNYAIQVLQVKNRIEPDGVAVRFRFQSVEPENLRFRLQVPDLRTGIGPFRGLGVIGSRGAIVDSSLETVVKKNWPAV